MLCVSLRRWHGLLIGELARRPTAFRGICHVAWQPQSCLSSCRFGIAVARAAVRRTRECPDLRPSKMVCGLTTPNQQHFTVKHMLRLTQVHVEMVTFFCYSVILGFQASLHRRVAAVCGGSDPIKASVYLAKPYKAKVNLRAACLSRCRAALASLVRFCLKTRLFFAFFFVAAGFDLMAYFNVREILGTREDDGQSSYVRLGTVPIVQQTE